MFNLKFYFMKKYFLFSTLVIFALLFAACEKKTVVEDPTNYVKAGSDASIATTFGTLTYLNTDGDTYVLNATIYAGMTLEQHDAGSDVNNPVSILKFNVVTDQKGYIPSGSYTISTDSVNVIKYAVLEYAPNGITSTVQPVNNILSSGTLDVNYDNGTYILNFDGLSRQGLAVKMHYTGLLMQIEDNIDQ